MKLVVVVGYRELLLPRALPVRTLRRLLGRRFEGARVPAPSWAPDHAAYHEFAVEDDARLDLLLEQLWDGSGPDEVPVLVAPILSCLARTAARGGGGPLASLRGRITARWPDRVVWRVLSWAEGSREVLRGLDPELSEAASPHDITELALDPLRVELGEPEAFLSEMQLNFTETVLELGRRITAPSALLACGPERAGRVTEQLHREHLALRPDVCVEDLRAGFGEGGLLRRLLTETVFGPG